MPDPSHFDPKPLAGIVSAIAATVVVPFKLFATNGRVKRTEQDVRDHDVRIRALEMGRVTKEDIDGVEERLVQVIHSNHLENRESIQAAVKRMDSFIDTVRLIKDSRESRQDREDRESRESAG